VHDLHPRRPTSELSAFPAAPRFRLAVAVGLGTLSIAGSLLLVVTDGVNASVHWTHHAGVSAAPLLFVAGAIAAMSIAHPPAWRRLVMRLVAMMAFAAWGLSQPFAGSVAAGLLDDAAILLVVLDAGSAVIADARTRLRTVRPAGWEAGRSHR
jgi:hypothetical protein